MNSIRTILLLTLSIILCAETFACSMYKVTKDDKTIVGNNEDFLTPNTQFWFEQGENGKYGVMYMGFLNGFPQGAINEAGLMFDGFYQPYLAVNNTVEKKEIPLPDALSNVMQNMSEVEEVRDYLKTINLSDLTTGQIVFVDRSGTYLIVEGDEFIVGDEAEKTFSNFYYSQTKSLAEVNLDYYQNGRAFLEASTSDANFDYCGEAMMNFSQNRLASTQYTTIYDLSKLTIRVYLFHDYSEFVEIDLEAELAKGDYQVMIPELFPKESVGYQHYLSYNNAEDPVTFIREYLEGNEISEKDFVAMGFDNIINEIGYEWLYDLENPEGAIKVFSYGLELMPNNANLYDSLGEAYMEEENWNKAKASYNRSLELNAENQNAIEKLREIDNFNK